MINYVLDYLFSLGIAIAAALLVVGIVLLMVQIGKWVGTPMFLAGFMVVCASVFVHMLRRHRR